MTKAFDSINKKLLTEDLKNLIDLYKLHLIKILLDVKLLVKCTCSTSECFNTEAGAPQGNSASANEFTHYLGKSLALIHTFKPTDQSCVLQEVCTAILDELT